jgi:hypothetical protein
MRQVLQFGEVCNDEVSEVPIIVHEVLRLPGQPLNPKTRAFFEASLGHDFSHVRVHANSTAADSASEVNALAYTVGPNIVFGDHQYAPHTRKGQLLLAHELAHTVQQSGKSPIYQTATIVHGETKAIGTNNSIGFETERFAEAGSWGVCLNTPLTNVSSQPRFILQRQRLTHRESRPRYSRRLSLQRFINLIRGATVTAATLAADPATTSAQLGEADSNGDGRISSDAEWRTLFLKINRHLAVRPGEPLRLRIGDRLTAAGLIVLAIARITGANRLLWEIGSVPMANVVTLLGMSDTAIREARALQHHHIPVQLITDIPSRGDEVRSIDGRRTFQLVHSSDRQSFINTLSMPRETQQQVFHVLDQVPHRARREIAELARVWSLAYSGYGIPRRVILSGHGDGTWITGDDHDFFNKNSILKLGRAMPQAARQIYSLHISSCQHGYDTRMRAFRSVFPNLQMIWGYAGSSPSGASAHRHMIVWERATRGFPVGGRTIDRPAISGTRRAGVAAVWTPNRGWQGPRLPPFAELLRDVVGREGVFQQYFHGNREDRDPGRGFLYNYYNLLQQLSVHPGMDTQGETTLRTWEHRRDQALRLRLYRKVARNFSIANRTKIERGYRAMGLNPPYPDFGHLTRRAALSEMRRFRQQMDRMGSIPSAVDHLWNQLMGLWVLDSTRIPMAWVE